MNILAIDDEAIMLNELACELQKVFLNAYIKKEKNPLSALNWIKQLQIEGQVLDYAFMDIRMNGMSGLELARQIKNIYPHTVLIFCTAYSEYAFDAVGMYAKGYLMKPISAEDIIRTLDEMVYNWRDMASKLTKDVRVQTFGHFEVFVDGQPLVFEREKAKELFAYLVDRHGASLTTEQISLVLWEDRVYDRTMKNYVSTILASLRNTLKMAEIENVLIKSRNHLSIDIDKIKCDAYDYEKWDAVAVNSFKGEYMVNYSWAEFTTGKYEQMQKMMNKENDNK